MDKYSKELINRNCIICNEIVFLELSTSMKKGPQLTTVICKNCSLVFTNPAPRQDVYYSFYTNDYERYYGESTATKPHESNEPAIFGELEKFIDLKSSSYVEIGPGRGLTLYHANKLFKKAVGVEPSVEFTNLLVSDYGLKVVHTTLEEFVDNYKGDVDVLSMFHVLEHIYDPHLALMSIRSILSEEGLVVIEVPNILKPFRSLDHYFLRYVHLFNFSPLTLRTLLRKSGFEILYENQGGDGWITPQNIRVIAKKSSSFSVDIFDPDETLNAMQILSNYRLRYNTDIRFRWFFYKLKKAIYRFFKSMKAILKRAFNTEK